jgi:uncharacterized protein YecE (DUF72 family)
VLATSIRELATRSRRVHVILNNNYEGQGQRNAAMLRRMLRAD